MFGYDYCSVGDLIGKVFTRVEKSGDTVELENREGKYVIEHHQDCCEHVYIEGIMGDLSLLENSEIRDANENSYAGRSEYDSCTITNFNIASEKGVVSIRFNGSSNGYYGEGASVYFYKYDEDLLDTDEETE